MHKINTSSIADIKPFINKLIRPIQDSHKGQNGRLLVIGGSELFHAASIWAAEIAASFVDMVHYSSTVQNNEVMKQLKILDRSGMVVSQTDIDHYIDEDDAILIGPGMLRDEVVRTTRNLGLVEILSLDSEAEKTFELVRYVISTHPDKRYVFDAGALQMMRPEWLTSLKKTPIITPHQIEYERLFGASIRDKDIVEKARAVEASARATGSVILLKAVDDIVSDGATTTIIMGGNAGLTKGGTGDILAGLIAALRTKNDPVVSVVIASYVLKTAADRLYASSGTWYNNSDLIGEIPKVLFSLI